MSSTVSDQGDVFQPLVVILSATVDDLDKNINDPSLIAARVSAEVTDMGNYWVQFQYGGHPYMYVDPNIILDVQDYNGQPHLGVVGARLDMYNAGGVSPQPFTLPFSPLILVLSSGIVQYAHVLMPNGAAAPTGTRYQEKPKPRGPPKGTISPWPEVVNQHCAPVLVPPGSMQVQALRANQIRLLAEAEARSKKSPSWDDSPSESFEPPPIKRTVWTSTFSTSDSPIAVLNDYALGNQLKAEYRVITVPRHPQNQFQTSVTLQGLTAQSNVCRTVKRSKEEAANAWLLAREKQLTGKVSEHYQAPMVTQAVRAAPTGAVARCNELCQRMKLQPPQYTSVNNGGPAHAPSWVYVVQTGPFRYQTPDSYPTKLEGKNAAAEGISKVINDSCASSRNE